MITKEEYKKYTSAGFNVVPISKELDIDSDSPLSLYSKIKDKENTFLLESVEGGERWAQYSIIGLNCTDYIKVSDNYMQLKECGEISSFESDNPLEEIKKITAKYKTPNIKNLPRFYGGYVGYFAYESSKYAEKRIKDLKDKSSKFKEHMPDIYLLKANKLIIFDNFNQKKYAIYNSDPSNCSYEEALSYVEDIQEDIDQNKNYAEPKYKNITGAHKFQSNFSKDSYIQSVKTIKNYIKEGDVMQVVLAQDFSSPFDSDPFYLYSALRKLNPSPYMYYLNLNECKVIGASPEILVRLEENDVTLRPIAGTRKRGADKIEDEENVKELLSDPKELAEHLMLIDLGRNDVGKVSEIGSVKVTEKMVIEKYSHVMHIVSNVVGKLLKGLSAIDALKETLPAGTLSGAPKIRAMEIINELEPSSRGIYGGAIGHISWNGNIDTAIAIRTAVIKDGLIHVGAGAGIVADSDPESEWRECVQKSKVFADAMEMIS